MSNRHFSIKRIAWTVSFSIPILLGALDAQAQPMPGGMGQGGTGAMQGGMGQGQQASPQTMQQFRQMDQNQDGYLTMNELSPQFRQMLGPVSLPHLDANRDGRLGIQEFTMAYQVAQRQDQPGQQAQGGQMQGGQAQDMPRPQVNVQQSPPQIQVQQRPPQLQVQQPPPQIQVQQPPPRVGIQQPPVQAQVQQVPPRIQVEQQPPRIMVEQVQPRVTVEQPQPKVTVQQLPPQINVQQAVPQVTIEQAPPVVRVSQAEPQVQFEQPPPQITIQQAEPQVTVAQVPPQVMVEQAQPQVLFQTQPPQVQQPQPQTSLQPPPPQGQTEQQAEPQATAQASAEPESRAQEQEKDQSQSEAQVQPQKQPSQLAFMAQSGEAAQQPSRAEVSAGSTMQLDLMTLRPEQIAGKVIVNSEGQELGDIEKLIRDQQGNIAAVVGVGGFLGVGEKQILVDITQLTLADDKVVMDALTQEMKEQPEYDPDRYQDITDSDQPIGQLAQSGGGMQTGSRSDAKGSQFTAMVELDKFDQDRDGYISQDEASGDPTLQERFGDYDKNDDQRLDQSEFSAFRAGQSTSPSP